MRLLLFFSILIIFFIKKILADDDDFVCKTKNPIKEFKDKLLCNYDKNELPRKTNILISVQMILKYIEYNDYTNKFKLNSWIMMFWKDRRLKFNSTVYGNDFLYVDSSDIWTLDLQLYDRIGDSERSLSDTSCLINKLGRVVCLFPTTHEAQCTPDITNWPYDIQNCLVNYAAWVKPKGRIILRLLSPFVRLSGYTKNPEWKLIKYNTYKYILKTYPGLENHTFPMISYNFTIQRHSEVHSCNIITSSLVLMFNTLITLQFDVNSFERYIIISISTVNHLWFVLQLLFTIPLRCESPPTLVYFLRNSFFITMLFVFETIIIRKWIHEKNKCGNTVLKISQLLNSTIVGSLLFINYKNENMENDLTIENYDDKKLVKLYKLIDRLFFIIFTIIYIYFFITLIPIKNYKIIYQRV